MFVEVAQILAQIVDGDTTAAWLCRTGHSGRFKGGDALAQYGNEITDDVRDGTVDAEDVGIQIPLRNVVADLARESGVELVLGDGLHHCARLVRAGRVGVERHVDGLGGNGNLVDFLPRPFEIGTAGHDDANLGILIALLFLRVQRSRDGIVEGGGSGNAFGSSKAGLYRPLVLINGVNPSRQITYQEPDHKTDENSDKNVRVHRECSPAPTYTNRSDLISK